eukprot:TRINITY_DN3712_c0_g1_i1.p1 TRINITY_DN3712_c0_g1~~TRINITY_DN3712_c0_g1_i1.p1  ORF type:complete len:102 (-),score=17.27 TRINITY_DN3712_c0_g1_i1:21-326(-)
MNKRLAFLLGLLFLLAAFTHVRASEVEEDTEIEGESQSSSILSGALGLNKWCPGGRVPVWCQNDSQICCKPNRICQYGIAYGTTMKMYQCVVDPRAADQSN